MAVAIPWLAMAAGTGGSLVAGAQQENALNANATVMGYEAKTAAAQGYQAEAQQRRKGSMILGAETTAVGQAGAGYGGSAGRSLKQSSLNAELDALNIRYKSQLQKWGYATQATNLRDEAKTAGNAGVLRAGASLLRGYSGNYVGNDLG